MKKTLTAIITIIALALMLPVAIGAQAKHVPNLTDLSRSIKSKRLPDLADAIPGGKVAIDSQLTWNPERRMLTLKGKKYALKVVKGGVFTMGANGSLIADADSDEKPAHKVKLESYYIGESEVPQWLWVAVMGSNPSEFKGDNLPVENVSYNDCIDFIKALNSHFDISLRLPTEAEWEYAAREGRSDTDYLYSGSDKIEDVAWYEGNSGSRTHPIKKKKANKLGLYDMSGNVSEWCADWMQPYSASPAVNPKGPASGSTRVFRGGAWVGAPRVNRISFRYYNDPDYKLNSIGLRLAM